MEKNEFWKMLQLFADGGDGGDGGADGTSAEAGADTSPVRTADDDGQARLMELGVPKELLRKGRNYSTKRNAPAKAESKAQSKNEQTDPAPEQNAQSADQSLDEILKTNPRAKSDVERMIQARLKKSKGTEDAMAALMPGLKQFAVDNGMDGENLDFTAIAKKLSGEYAQKALELGVSEDTAMEWDMKDREAERVKTRDHFMKLEQQAEVLRQTFPNFDLRTELSNPKFLMLTSPKAAELGITLEDAHFLVHRDELQKLSMQVTASKTAEMVSNAVASNTMRPNESGVRTAPAQMVPKSYADMSPAERQAFRQRIMATEGTGRYIRPGE